MTNGLIEHIRKFVTLDEKEAELLFQQIEPLSLKKKEIVLKEGQVCKSQYFVAQGCIRLYYIHEKGMEQISQFAIENWWLADYVSFNLRKPSDYYIQAVEPAVVYALDYNKQEQLFKEIPQLESYFRIVYQKAYAAAQNRIKYLNDFSREELYQHFNDSFPEFVQRIPQYMLASFLGLTPEYLSEIRKKQSRKSIS